PVGEAPVVLSGFDKVAHSDGLGAGLGADSEAAGLDLASDDARGMRPVGELGGGGVVLGQHDRVAARLMGSPPTLEALPARARVAAAMDPAVLTEALEPGG